MVYNFFIPDQNELEKVIQDTLKDQDNFVSAKTIQTGWTNITMDVKGESQDYIFRFPRNFFFARMMVKDCIFCNFLQGKVTLPIPDMKLKIHNNRPFSVHTKIKGTSLASKLDQLSESQRTCAIDDLSQFLVQLHALPAKAMPSEISESLSHFLDGLASVHQGNYDFNQHQPLRTMEQQTTRPCIVHGDFHPGNVLIDESGRISGIIDFSFASISDNHADLGRFTGRSNPALGQELVEAYQNKTRKTCDTKKIQDVVDVFKYVEYKYVEYMQSNHPEITIPESVLKVSAMEAQKYQQDVYA